MVSVVIPAFNRADEILYAVWSALDQTLPVGEIIVVDDASLDGTEKIDFAAIDPRVRLIQHDRNRGGSTARNTGIDAARFPLIALLDSDDRWLPGKLAAQIAAIGDRKLTDHFVICSNVTVDRLGKRLLHNRRGPNPGESIADYLLVARAALQTSTLLLPTEFARSVRFRDGLRRCQDLDFVLRLEQAGAEMVYLDEPLTIYYQRADPGRITRQPKGFEATIEWYKVARDLVPARAMQSFFVHSAMGKNWLHHPGATLKAFLWVAFTSPFGLLRMSWMYMAMIVGRVINKFTPETEYLR
ncbi:hypothetical protein BH11PSE2_BH11PSE2_17950 [soil metagenome]